MTGLTPDLAARFATLTLGHLEREWPNMLDHVLTGPADVAGPRALHPVFFGSFDWHSCVHGWWQVLRIARAFPDLPVAAIIRARADAMLVADKVAGEIAYLARAGAAGFERPYGWGWLLALHHEARRHDAGWGEALAPLAAAFAQRFHAFLPKLTYPVRAGTHGNTAFALAMARPWAMACDADLLALIDARARDWFGTDCGCQAWEPSGDDFLSPALIEALLMARVLGPLDFAAWFAGFLPEAAAGSPVTLFLPVFVSDRRDGKIVHLDGLNLSRAWCWRGIADALAPHPLEDRFADAATAHLAAGLPHLARDYMGEHWLATFALLALAGD